MSDLDVCLVYAEGTVSELNVTRPLTSQLYAYNFMYVFIYFRQKWLACVFFTALTLMCAWCTLRVLRIRGSFVVTVILPQATHTHTRFQS